MIDPRNRHLAREGDLHGTPCVGQLLGAGTSGARKEGVEFRRVEVRIVECAAALASIEHRAEKRQRNVTGNSGDEHVELLWASARPGEERAHLELADGNIDSA